MRFTHDDRATGFFHELRTELRNDVTWLIHQRTSHTTGESSTEGRIIADPDALARSFARCVRTILTPLIGA